MMDYWIERFQKYFLMAQYDEMCSDMIELKKINSVEFIYENIVFPGITWVADLFEAGDIFIPDLLVALDSYNKFVAWINDNTTFNIPKKGKVAIGVVKNDLHSIGKDILCSLLRVYEMEVIDLGCDVSDEKFVSASKEKDIEVIGITAMLSNTMLQMEDIIKKIRTNSRCSTCFVVVGGAPVTADYAKSIGADFYAYNAVTTAKWIRNTCMSLSKTK